MAIGPGRYDHLATRVRQQTQARGVLLLVIGGIKGSGFSAQLSLEEALRIPDMLRNIADEIERDGIAGAGVAGRA